MTGRSQISMAPHSITGRTKNCAGLSLFFPTLLVLLSSAPLVRAQQRREREPNSVYAARRAKLASEVDAPVLLWGFTGREESSMAYVFAQEENFYYLTGHNEEGAGLILLPTREKRKAASWNGPREMLFLPPKNPEQEKW
ncbi:MAG: aminopeptidase P N-terminal domain-containing protein, partial [Candidatus Acidiferrum sp.]